MVSSRSLLFPIGATLLLGASTVFAATTCSLSSQCPEDAPCCSRELTNSALPPLPPLTPHVRPTLHAHQRRASVPRSTTHVPIHTPSPISHVSHTCSQQQPQVHDHHLLLSKTSQLTMSSLSTYRIRPMRHWCLLPRRVRPAHVLLAGLVRARAPVRVAHHDPQHHGRLHRQRGRLPGRPVQGRLGAERWLAGAAERRRRGSDHAQGLGGHGARQYRLHVVRLRQGEDEDGSRRRRGLSVHLAE